MQRWCILHPPPPIGA